MRSRTRCWTAVPFLIAAAMAWGCADNPTQPLSTTATHLDAVKFWESLATTRWNLRATDLLQGTASDDLPLGVPAPQNGQAWASRMLTYLSLAQYRAALA